VKKIIYFLMVGCAVLVLQAATVAAQAPVPNMPPPMAPPMGDPNMPPPMGGAPGVPAPMGGEPGEPDLDSMTDEELEKMFADAPEEDAGAAPGVPGGIPPVGAPPAPR
jgi:hypothetical protein